MGAPDAPSGMGLTADALQAYTTYLPGLIAEMNRQAVPTARAQADATAATAGDYNRLSLDQLNKFGVPMAEAGQRINQSNALGDARTNTALLTGAGGESARAADALSRELNPEVYSARNKVMELLGSINLDGLSGGERTEVERSLNQSNTATGNLGVDNATNAVSNAMQFGGALNTKRTALSNALNTATNVMNAGSAATFNPVSTALNRPAISTNTGTNAFAPVSSAASSGSGANQGLASSLLGTIGNVMTAGNATQAQSRTANSPAALTSSILGSTVCCFIFLEAYNGTLPWWVRVSRDNYYRQSPDVAKGYKLMAKWLVPLMRRSSLVAKLINKYMVLPLTRYGGWLHHVEGYEDGHRYAPAKRLWFRVWSTLGKL